ncbi:M20 family metallopeptidase [Haloferax volcanii]|uniref:M20 family metallopeptidase n=1 Tax=Haloferax volcanii TaxID=2246 RepID=A0A558GCI5_HALVO|nr:MULTISPECIES: M20 family metallopeptidase [Haloferax]NLV02859.1 M20/M25/M40 family metallo-hydrolase [Haloferax alexandrinus]TVT95472.1 M20 family metallopeptidase [Haloferax volcanii]
MSSDPPAVVASLREHREDVVDLAATLVGHDTQNPPGDTRDLASWVESFLADLGIEAERVTSDPRKPNLVATLPGATDRTLVLLGHLDTVPFDAGEWTRDPLGERAGNRLYGRGATDMKGAVAAMLAVANAYVETDTTPATTLVFAFVSDEEVAGSAGLPTLLDRRGLAADACVIGETTCESDRHSVTVADRGSIWLELEATGTAAHGSRPMLGENAIHRLYRAVSDIESTLDDYRFEFDPAVRALVDESVEYYAPRFGADAARELFERPSVNLGVLSGGDRVNVVPDAARAKLDIRVTAGVETAAVLDRVREVVAGHDGVETSDADWSVGTFEDPDSALADAVVSVAEGVTGGRVYRRSATGGGDAKRMRNAGVPTVEFGLGTETAHAVDEFTTVEALVGNAEVYARLPDELLRQFDSGTRTFDSTGVSPADTTPSRRDRRENTSDDTR